VISELIERHLDPASRLGEVLFGLIMVLTVTLTAGLTVAQGPTAVRQLLWAAISCNLAWGVIDGAMYLMSTVTDRARERLLICRVQSASDRNAALQFIREDLEVRLGPLGSVARLETTGSHLLDELSHADPRQSLIRRQDVLGALACFWLVFLSCVPAATPFLIVSDPVVALRISNVILIGMLFFVGQKWAVHAGLNRLAAGAAMVAMGLAMVGIAVLLGG
jgi:hypothetical protein